MRMNDSEMTMRWSNKARSIPEIYPSKGRLGRETKEEKKSEKDEFLVFWESQKEKGKIEVN